MKKLVESAVVLLVLVLLVSVGVSCAPAATPAPQVAVPAASPTSAQVAVATPVPTPVPTGEPTAAPTPELTALMDSGALVAILDVRPRESYEVAHIKGAVLFPWKAELSVVDLEMLPRGDPIITYCDCGPGEADSADVAFQLIELGAQADVKVLADPSIEGWIAAGYPTQ
jgi:rhodanese-related sulfurtransferase